MLWTCHFSHHQQHRDSEEMQHKRGWQSQLPKLPLLQAVPKPHKCRSHPWAQVGWREPGPAGTHSPAPAADVSSRESSCATAPRVLHTRHKWLPAAAAGKCQGRKAWQAWDFRRGWSAPHLTWGHGIFDRTITITELIKCIWKGFCVAFGIGYEGPRNPLWGLKCVAKLQQKPYVVHISTFFFSLAPFSRPAVSAASGLRDHLSPGEIPGRWCQ